LVAKYDEVFSRRDPAAVAALFTEDAVRVTPRGTFTGRAAIEKSFTDGDYQFYHSTDLFRIGRQDLLGSAIFLPSAFITVSFR